MQLSCRLFGISRQSYYKRCKSSLVIEAQQQLVVGLVGRQRRHMPRLGTRKLHKLLQEDFRRRGLKIGRDKLFAYLRQQHLLIRPVKSYTKTTHSKHWLHKHANLIKHFKPTAAEQLWVSDITYMNTRQKTCYLSLITDAYSRKIVGYHVSEDLRAEHMLEALKMAIKGKVTNQPTIHHSDRGLQYCADAYQQLLAAHHVRCSMTDGYDCYQNALAERMNGILKMEFLFEKHLDYESLNKSVRESIITYNTHRPHLSLVYQTPESVHKKSLAEYNQGS